MPPPLSRTAHKKLEVDKKFAPFRGLGEGCMEAVARGYRLRL
jgi:hypothetical protein